MVKEYKYLYFIQHVFKSLLEKHAKLQIHSVTRGSDRQVLNEGDKQAVEKLLKQLEAGSSSEGHRACLCVLGRYNVGKSTLLNALLSARWVNRQLVFGVSCVCTVCWKKCHCH